MDNSSCVFAYVVVYLSYCVGFLYIFFFFCLSYFCFFFFFFFQAEDGIRDTSVTGVQTCALPISCVTRTLVRHAPVRALVTDACSTKVRVTQAAAAHFSSENGPLFLGGHPMAEIGRASCRERVYISVVEVASKKRKMSERRNISDR